ncbi:methylmalonyl-CoA mutase family protein [Bacillus sp. REN10]|uniref:methylmalonyl-CoA mutase family protein n=1 Tax=Bacillus sp. REN10 TaxID=2782541 RepID=UPI00193B2BDB|nr:methylmalonyl-CoA mutase family protein [Bacillus sp. REN10]
MKMQEMKAQRFDQVSLEEWEKTAEASLKGKPLAKLYTETYEEITLKPLYVKADIEQVGTKQFPGVPDYTRGFYKGGYEEKPLKGAPPLKAHSASDLQAKRFAAMQAGQNAFSFSIEEQARMTFYECCELLSSSYPLYINTKDHFLAFSAFLLKAEAGELQGVVGTDLLSHFATKGLLPDEQALAFHFEAVAEMKQRYPKVKTMVINTVPYHEAGANAVQEIAIALSEAVFYLESLKEKGWTPAEAIQSFSFHFAIGSQFFMEVAKLRAFRQLWTALCEAYEVDGEAVKVTIGAETSEFTLSKLDRHVNILRTGTEAFAALLGGVEYLQVTPFDQFNGAPSVLAERVAKNIPLILQSESHLTKVVDPAGGSYFVESLTSELAQAAWQKFMDIEECGGVLAVLKEGTLQKELAQLLEQRISDLAMRKKSLIGTNIYADLNETLSSGPAAMEVLLADREISSYEELLGQVVATKTLAELHVRDRGEQVIPVKAQRLAEPFEQLRERAAGIQASGKVIQAGLICLGKLKDFKPRADYVTGVLSTGGISVQLSDECHSMEEVLRYVKETQFPYYCICGKDEIYREFGPSLVAELKQTGAAIQVDVAGKLSEEENTEWLAAGLDGCVFAGQNLLDKLSSLLTLWEGEHPHE